MNLCNKATASEGVVCFSTNASCEWVYVVKDDFVVWK